MALTRHPREPRTSNYYSLHHNVLPFVKTAALSLFLFSADTFSLPGVPWCAHFPCFVSFFPFLVPTLFLISIYYGKPREAVTTGSCTTRTRVLSRRDNALTHLRANFQRSSTRTHGEQYDETRFLRIFFFFCFANQLLRILFIFIFFYFLILFKVNKLFGFFFLGNRVGRLMVHHTIAGR